MLEVILLCKFLPFSAVETWSIVTHYCIWYAMSGKMDFACVMTQVDDVFDSNAISGKFE